MLIIGIDPGITGSICFFQDGKIIDVIEMPNMPEGKKNKKSERVPFLPNPASLPPLCARAGSAKRGQLSTTSALTDHSAIGHFFFCFFLHIVSLSHGQ